MDVITTMCWHFPHFADVKTEASGGEMVKVQIQVESRVLLGWILAKQSLVSVSLGTRKTSKAGK